MSRIAILGGGKMGEALARGIMRSGLYKVVISDVAKERVAALRKIGLDAIYSNIEAASGADVVIIAVKPQYVKEVLQELGAILSPDALVISIAAGVTLKYLEDVLPSAKFIRVMPNIAASVSSALIAISPGKVTGDQEMDLVKTLFNPIGKPLQVAESQMDAVTGLNGSGSAFIFTIIEALVDGGVKMGIPEDKATLIAAQVTFGAAKMVLETGKHPAELRNMVATPAGTTVEGLLKLEEGCVRATLVKAVEASTRRAAEISRSLEKGI